MLAAILLALAASAVADAAARPPVAALTASPARLALARTGRGEIRVANSGATALVVDVARAGLALAANGRPRALLGGAAARRAAAFLSVRPARLVLGPGRSARVTVTATVRSRRVAGDHPALVLLTARTSGARAVALHLRIGVTVIVRAGGKVLHRLVVRGLHVRSSGRTSVVVASVANLGNSVERLPAGALAVSLSARGRLLARLHSQPRELLPGSVASLAFPYRGREHGPVTAAVALSEPGRSGPVTSRRFRLTL
jgi:hypothetical protein